MNQRAIPYMHLRGGSSKGLYFLAVDLPAEASLRDQRLLDIVGRDSRQIDGLHGGDPLTSKVSIVGPATRDDADVDYLFVQVVVGENRVDTTPNCGNILAGVGPFAIESGLFPAKDSETRLRVHMVNSGKVCELVLQTPGRARITMNRGGGTFVSRRLVACPVKTVEWAMNQFELPPAAQKRHGMSYSKTISQRRGFSA